MKKKQILPILIAVGCVLLALASIGVFKLIQKYTPTKERLELKEYYNIDEESKVAITLNHTVLDNFATMINGHVYLDYEFVHDILNERFYWDANENILLYTTASNIISAKADETSYSVGKSNTNYDRPIVKATASSAWVDLEFVKNYSDFSYSLYETPNRIVIINEWKEITTSTLKNNTELRVKGGIKSPILADLKKGDVLTILEADEKWTKVCTSDGITGYVRTKQVKNTEPLVLTSDYEEETFLHMKKDQAINFLWHPVSGPRANNEITTILSTTKGVDVVSPTWFKFKDNNGNLISYASNDYVTYCHDHNVEVWGLVSNIGLADGVDTNEILTHTSSRQNLVNQLVSLALQYNLDGINVDFESLDDKKIGDSYIQFLRELSIKCENNDIVLSTAVAIPASFNQVYKYSEQAYFVDYVCVMAYDQHYGQASGAGSVASLNWVEESIQNTLAEGIPGDQILLGVPFYSKLWNLTPTSDDAENPSYLIGFKNQSLNTAKNWMDTNVSNPQWLEDIGQYYGEIETNGIIYKLWLEDATSIEKKLELLEKYKLAGAAFWSSDWDNTTIWDVIIKYIN